jgi:hypothetical protein
VVLVGESDGDGKEEKRMKKSAGYGVSGIGY